MNLALPRSWATITIGETGRYVNGLAFKPSDWKREGRPIIRIQNLTNPDAPFNHTGRDVPSDVVVSRGDILVSWSATLDAFRWNGPESVLNQHIFRVVPGPVVEPTFLFHGLRIVIREMWDSEHTHGSTMRHINRGPFLAHRFPLPPLDEQRRIVAKLEVLQSRARRAREALDTVPPLLEKLRQSILAAAFRGDLTKDWRVKETNPEPGSALLARIRTERLQKWETAELAKLKAKGRPPTNDGWKAKYIEPESVDSTGLDELPDGWCWTSLGEAFEVRVGATPSRSEPSYWGGDVPWVSSGEVAFCRIRETRESITKIGLANTSTQVHPRGTVLLGMIGEGKTRGQAAILEIDACNNQNSAAILVSATEVPPGYVYRYLEFEYERTRNVGSGNNQQALNKTRVEAIRLPLAPMPEQQEIERRLEALLAMADVLASALNDVSTRNEALDRAILVKAFRGELVPQDPNDESAESMLARFRAEAPADSLRRGPRRAKAAESKPSTSSSVKRTRD